MIKLTKAEMIEIIKILEWHTNLVMDIQLQHFDANETGTAAAS
jgi:hypothetical protein